jgi:hypothetical protein
MGLCGSSLSEEEKVAVAETQKADQFLKKSGTEDKKVVKLLLLGLHFFHFFLSLPLPSSLFSFLPSSPRVRHRYW